MYGVVLSLARSLGEFGAVKVVSGNVIGQTQTATVLVQQKYQNFEQTTAYSVSFMLAFAAVVCLVVVSVLRTKENHEHRGRETSRKRFGDFVALDDVTCPSPPAAHRAPRSRRVAASRPCCGSSPASSPPTPAR